MKMKARNKKARKIYQSILLSFTLIGFATSAMAVNQATDKRYDWSKTADFSALRKTIGWSDSYEARCVNGRPLKQLHQSINNENWSQAVTTGKKWLNQCPIDMHIHKYVGLSMSQMGDQEGAKNHFRWMDGLMSDVLASGDGKTQDKAFEVISISEEYDVIRMFGLQPQSQALINGSDGTMYDLMTVADSEGNQIQLYFNPAAHFERLSKMFD